MPEWPAHELQRLLPQLGSLDPFLQDPVAVQQEQRHQVEEVVDVGGDRDLEEERGQQRRPGQEGDQDRAEARHDETGVWPGPEDGDATGPGD